MTEYLTGDDCNSRTLLWETFESDFNQGNIKNYQSLIETGQTKGQYVIDECEDIINNLETIFNKFLHILACDVSPDHNGGSKSDFINALIWTLDQVMEGMLGITRVVSCSNQNLSNALLYNKREKQHLSVHKDGGYFAMLKFKEYKNILNRAKNFSKENRRRSEVSFDDALKLFSADKKENTKVAGTNPQQIISSKPLQNEDLSMQTNNISEFDEYLIMMNDLQHTAVPIQESKTPGTPNTPHSNIINEKGKIFCTKEHSTQFPEESSLIVTCKIFSYVNMYVCHIHLFIILINL